MPLKSRSYRWLMFTSLFLALFVAGCVSNIQEQTIRTGDEGTPCRLLGSLPLAPDGDQELSDAASLDMVAKLTSAFKANAQVATVKGQAYLTTLPFSEIVGFYEAELQPGWEYRENIVSQVSQDTASVAAWSSCRDELVAIFFYENVNPDSNGLTVLYAKP